MAPAATAASAAGPKAVGHGRVIPVHVTPSGTDAVLYNQNDNDAGIGISSQNFEAQFDAFDDSGADDFTVPANVKSKVKEVDVTGTYDGFPGPAVSETVTFYKSKHHLPGLQVAQVANVVGIDDGFGNFQIKFPSPVKLKGGTTGKTYWVGVVANMDFNVGGQWYWETRTVQNGDGAAWENPGGGFGIGCTTWDRLTTCIAAGEGPDFMFALIGKQV